MVANALSTKNHGSIATLQTIQKPLFVEIQNLGLEIVPQGKLGYLSSLTLKPTLLEKIKTLQYEDTRVLKFRTEVTDGKRSDFIISSDGALRYCKRLVVPDNQELKLEIVSEAHYTPYSILPGSTKMF